MSSVETGRLCTPYAFRPFVIEGTYRIIEDTPQIQPSPLLSPAVRTDIPSSLNTSTCTETTAPLSHAVKEVFEENQQTRSPHYPAASIVERYRRVQNLTSHPATPLVDCRIP